MVRATWQLQGQCEGRYCGRTFIRIHDKSNLLAGCHSLSRVTVAIADNVGANIPVRGSGLPAVQLYKFSGFGFRKGEQIILTTFIWGPSGTFTVVWALSNWTPFARTINRSSLLMTVDPAKLY